MFKRLPRSILGGAGDALRNEVHAIDTVGDVGIETVGIVELLPAGSRDHILICRRVDIGKRFEESFGMAAGNARRAPGQFTEVRPAGAGVNLVWFAVGAEEHFVRLFLMPFERAFGAVDLDPCFILAAMRDLRGGDGAERAIAVAKDGGTVIVERPARLERFQMTGNLFGNQPGDEATEIIGMSADVAEAAGRA